ncbi:helix-turn-helix transcriptional regulator [Mesorhizobium sp. BH1-1-4]|uniref:helix-turn-helix transcriptional regulator n=1 Tax=Mesorhizobium sp. BH1-1-4 TaxID=2876662 RepID=UPI001CD1043A|nr:AraC family transcriptional regulator [Mesorhizobium sp. BH1-1-4]MBZ9993127.1 AraC family transcriptional regulator [Mesorhizobium sp. BH1-1-4]
MFARPKNSPSTGSSERNSKVSDDNHSRAAKTQDSRTTSGFFARFRTEDLPEQERVAAVRNVLLHKPVAFDVGALRDGSFRADMQVRELPGLEITVGHITSHTTRTKPIMGDGSDDLLLSICVEGRLEIEHRGKLINVPPGNAHLGSCADPIAYHTDVQRGISLRVPRHAVSAFVPDIDGRIGMPVPHVAESLRLIDVYVRALERDTFYATPGMSRMAVNHVQDLVALALESTGDAGVYLADRGLRAARLIAVKKDIVDTLGQDDVSAESLAMRHGISSRYIRKLFEFEGATLSAFVLEERLRRADRLLSSPLHHHRQIGSIAYDVGFRDLSYFNRTFRRRFGMSPSEARHRDR